MWQVHRQMKESFHGHSFYLDIPVNPNIYHDYLNCIDALLDSGVTLNYCQQQWIFCMHHTQQMGHAHTAHCKSTAKVSRKLVGLGHPKLPSVFHPNLESNQLKARLPTGGYGSSY